MPTATKLRENGHGAAPRSSRSTSPKVGTKAVNLALQGGGAHGAFAWGVLDRLLEDERITFDGISACSAGAMNAVVFAYGWTEGGRGGAKTALANFWRRVSHQALFSPIQPTLLDRLTHNHSLDMSPSFLFFDILTRLLSPYQFNPLNRNPLREVLEASVDMERIRKSCSTQLFISATNVVTGKIRVFQHHELTIDSILASACLPFLFQAVEIDGEHYWDGGYMGNPALYPLIYNCSSADIVIVHINPITRSEVPRTAPDILNRINEISFNSSLMREMRAIAFVTRLIDDGSVNSPALKRMFIHSIESEGFMSELSVSSKMNADWEFLTHLRDVGREAANSWLAKHYDDVGVNSSVDIYEQFL